MTLEDIYFIIKSQSDLTCILGVIIILFLFLLGWQLNHISSVLIDIRDMPIKNKDKR